MSNSNNSSSCSGFEDCLKFRSNELSKQYLLTGLVKEINSSDMIRTELKINTLENINYQGCLLIVLIDMLSIDKQYINCNVFLYSKQMF